MKKYIIIFSLILSVLFLNINNTTGVYCATTIVNVNIENFDGNTDDLNFYYNYPLMKFNKYGVRELDGITYLTFTYSTTFSSSEYSKFSLYYNSELIETESISSSGSEIFVIPIFKTETESTETTESTESTEDTESSESTESSELPSNPVVTLDVDKLHNDLVIIIVLIACWIGVKTTMLIVDNLNGK